MGYDAYRHAVYVGESGNQRGAVAGLEFIEFRTVDDAGDNFTHVVRLAGVVGDDAVQLLWIVQGLGVGLSLQLDRLVVVPPAHRIACQIQRMQVVVGQVIGHATPARVHLPAPPDSRTNGSATRR